MREHDPHLALDGGNDGYDAYRALIPQAAERLAPGGALIVEAGQGQARDIETLMTAAALSWTGRPRPIWRASRGRFRPGKCPHKSRIGLQKTSWNIPWERLPSDQHIGAGPVDLRAKAGLSGESLLI